SSAASADHAFVETKPPAGDAPMDMPPAKSSAGATLSTQAEEPQLRLRSEDTFESDVVESPQSPPPVSFSSRNETAVGEKKNINHLLANFTQDEFGAIVDKLEPLEFMDGERIIAEGEEGGGMYL